MSKLATPTLLRTRKCPACRRGWFDRPSLIEDSRPAVANRPHRAFANLMATRLGIALLAGILPQVVHAQADSGVASDSALPPATFTVGLNVLQPVVGHAITMSISDGGEHALYPFSLELQKSVRGRLSLGAVALYEYNRDNVLRTNEVALGVGPRYSFSETAFDGFYVSYRFGFGYGWGKNYGGNDYSRFSILSIPELGVSHCWSSPGFYLAGGLGIRSFSTVHESPAPIDWNKFSEICRTLLPVFNLTVGHCR